jgi:Circularly permutated YpsA SLOG family
MMFAPLTRIVSGGQTGADRGALNAARALSLPIGGWAPQGWRAEDGCIPLELRQHMRESASPNYGLRTRLNVQDSDGTLILSFASTLTGGSKFTVDQVRAQRKPCKHLVLPRGSGVVPGEVTAALWDWIDEKKIAVLNVAGPRESKERGIQAAVERVIRDLLEARHRSVLMAAMAIGDAWTDAMQDHVFRSAFADNGEGIKEAAKTGVLRMACTDCGSRESCSCAMRAYAAGEMAAARKALERDDEIRASGKYDDVDSLVAPAPLQRVRTDDELDALLESADIVAEMAGLTYGNVPPRARRLYAEVTARCDSPHDEVVAEEIRHALGRIKSEVRRLHHGAVCQGAVFLVVPHGASSAVDPATGLVTLQALYEVVK